MRAPINGDAFECKDTKAVFSIVGVRQAGKGAGGADYDLSRWAIVMVCVVGPTCDWGDRTKLGDMHHIGGTWESLEDDYTLLTA